MSLCCSIFIANIDKKKKILETPDNMLSQEVRRVQNTEQLVLSDKRLKLGEPLNVHKM